MALQYVLVRFFEKRSASKEFSKKDTRNGEG